MKVQLDLSVKKLEIIGTAPLNKVIDLIKSVDPENWDKWSIESRQEFIPLNPYPYVLPPPFEITCDDSVSPVSSNDISTALMEASKHRSTGRLVPDNITSKTPKDQ